MKKTKLKNKITIEELARMVAAGFEENSGRFNMVEGRLGTLENRFDRLEEKVDSLITGQNRMMDILLHHTATKADVRDLDRRLVRVEQHLHLA